MAIIVEENKKGFNWLAIVVFIFLLAVIFGGAYLLFFAPTPGIEVVAPTLLKTTAEISQIRFDASAVINHPSLKTLRQFGGLPTVGQLGRPNPLISF